MSINTSEVQTTNKLIDMHSHTYYSDGDYLPLELIHMAINQGIGILGITDHDTVEGLKKVDRNDKKIKQSGIIIVDGIELSALAKKGQIHILGYGINPNDKYLNEMVSLLRQYSIDLLLAVRSEVEKTYNSIRFNERDIESIVNSERNIGRPDLAKLLVDYGYVKTAQEAFKSYLIEPYEKVRGNRKGLHYNECIELITQCGGIPVLAHPKSLKMDETEFTNTLKDMMSHGLEGIEAFHSSHSPEEMSYYENVAHINNLFISLGSDFHGLKLKPNIYLGTGENNNLEGKSKRITLVNELYRRSMIR